MHAGGVADSHAHWNEEKDPLEVIDISINLRFFSFYNCNPFGLGVESSRTLELKAAPNKLKFGVKKK
jgi:hypothetical protein